MTCVSKSFGRPRTYPFHDMSKGDSVTLDAPTPADVKRIARNASQYGLRHDRRYMCRTDPNSRVMTITRLR